MRYFNAASPGAVALRHPPTPDARLGEYVQRAFEMIGNRAPFDATGHPALSLPCGLSEGLPIGMMLVGKHFDEATLYKAAFAFEQSCDWKGLSWRWSKPPFLFPS